jgi:hypothetical protein
VKIQVEVEIFDDAEYCGECIITDICDFLLHGNCVKFINKTEPRKTDTFVKKRFTRLKFDHNKDMYLKCPQCKEEYQKAQESNYIEREVHRRAISKPQYTIKTAG